MNELMDVLAIVLPLAAFLGLAAAFAVIFRRAGRLLAATRHVERFSRQAGDLGSRIETSLGEISLRVDAFRRGQIEPTAISADLTASLDAVNRYTTEATALQPPHDAARIRTGLVNELGRASRALSMIEHGCSIMLAARAGVRETEAQTAIKRGYLNVLHAREAIHRYRLEAIALTPTEAARRGLVPSLAPVVAAPVAEPSAAVVDTAPIQPEPPQDHRM